MLNIFLRHCLLIKIAFLTWGVYNANRRTPHCSQTNTKKILQINSVGQKLSTVWGNFSQGAGMPGTESERHWVFTAGGEKLLPGELAEYIYISRMSCCCNINNLNFKKIIIYKKYIAIVNSMHQFETKAVFVAKVKILTDIKICSVLIFLKILSKIVANSCF
jgi:hypothetical protein